MKKLILACSFAILLAGCATKNSAIPSEKRAFYTPEGWQEPIDSPFFPKTKSGGYENGPEGFTPDFDGVPEKKAEIAENTLNTDGQKPEAAEVTLAPLPDSEAPNASEIDVPNKNDGQFQPVFAQKPIVGKAGSGEQMQGHASWYGPGFHGKKTANGETYNQYDQTAAHKLLPMNTLVRVTNVENGRSTIVRVNDRGPYKKQRVIDLSKTAADKIGMLEKGTAAVELEVVRYPKGYDPSQGLTPYKQVVVQLAVFGSESNADSFKNELASKFGTIQFLVDKKEKNHHVVAGPFNARDDAKKVRRFLISKGYNNFIRSYRK